MENQQASSRGYTAAIKCSVAKLSRLSTVVAVLLSATLLTSCLPEDLAVETSVESSPIQEAPSVQESFPFEGAVEEEENEEKVEEKPEAVTLVKIIDGDTLTTSAGKVRIIGIDTPEAGECGFSEAIKAIDRVVAVSDPIALELPAGQNDTDRYDRLLRYVFTESGLDLGFMLIEAGLAVARYDSTDGYPYHPKQNSYRSAQTATLDANGSVITVECKAEADRQASAPSIKQESEIEEPEKWYMQYRSCSHLKKNTVGHPKGPFNVNDPAEVDIYNWFQYGTGFSGDGDGDGLACE